MTLCIVLSSILASGSSCSEFCNESRQSVLDNEGCGFLANEIYAVSSVIEKTSECRLVVKAVTSWGCMCGAMTS